MQLPRMKHECCTIGQTVYVFCGQAPKNKSHSENSIESLELNFSRYRGLYSFASASEWQLLSLQNSMAPRRGLGVAQVSPTEIVMLGGLDASGRPLKDFFIFDAQQMTVREVNSFEEGTQTVVPHNFPCIRTQENFVLTIDLHTRRIIQYNHEAGKINVVTAVGLAT